MDVRRATTSTARRLKWAVWGMLGESVAKPPLRVVTPEPGRTALTRRLGVVRVCESCGQLAANDAVPVRQQLRQPALPGAIPLMRGMVARFVARLDVPRTRSADIQLAVTEACANVVRHAYPDHVGDVQCECEATDHEIVIRVSDWGMGSNQPSAQPGLGLGIPLIQRLSDHTTQSHRHGLTLVEMRFARSGVR